MIPRALKGSWAKSPRAEWRSSAADPVTGDSVRRLAGSGSAGNCSRRPRPTKRCGGWPRARETAPTRAHQESNHVDGHGHCVVLPDHRDGPASQKSHVDSQSNRAIV